jgi:hypothetical protein
LKVGKELTNRNASKGGKSDRKLYIPSLWFQNAITKQKINFVHEQHFVERQNRR